MLGAGREVRTDKLHERSYGPPLNACLNQLMKNAHQGCQLVRIGFQHIQPPRNALLVVLQLTAAFASSHVPVIMAVRNARQWADEEESCH